MRSDLPIGTLSILLLLVTALAPPAKAQGWTAELSGGRIAYESAAEDLGGTGLIGGVRYGGGDTGWLYLSTGVPLGSDDSVWGAGGVGRRFLREAGPVDLGIDLGLHGHLHRDPTLSEIGRGGTLEAHPLIAYTGGRARLEVRPGWVQYGASFAGTDISRGVHDSDARLDLTVDPRVRLSAIARHVRAEEDSYSRLGARITGGGDRFAGWAAVGGWLHDALPTTEWSAGLTAALDQAARTNVVVSFRRDAMDPVYWNGPRERWSLGVRHRLGGGGGDAASRTTAPNPDRERLRSTIGEVSAGTVTIEIPVEDSRDTGDSGDAGASAPSIAGDFTDWEPVEMERANDRWIATFELGPGVYHYAFRSADGEWHVPPSIPNQRDDGMGGTVAVLVVSGS